MKIWFDSEGKSAGKKRYFAVVEEIMVDKDGKPVGYPASSVEVEEPVVEPEVVEVAPATEVVEVAPAANDNNVAELITDVIEKVDIIIDILLANQAKQEEPAEEEVVEEEPVEEVAEEVEEAPAEEPAEEEVVEEEIFDVSDEDVTIYTSFGDEPAEEEAVAEEPAAEVEEAPAEEETAAAEAAIVMPEAEAKAPARRSPFFAEKMMAADEVLQDRYDELKNYALRFRKLKARISKKFDSINQGRFQFVKLSVAGKTLKLYLNMDINTTDPKFHCKDMSDKKTYVTVPTLLRIKSGRAVKYAKILIDQCAEQHGMLERRKPFIVDSMALIEESLKGKEEPEVDTDTEVVDGGEE